MLMISDAITGSLSGGTNHYLWRVFCLLGEGISVQLRVVLQPEAYTIIFLHLPRSWGYRQASFGAYELFLPQIISPKPVKYLDL